MENNRPDKKKNSEESDDDTLYITATDQQPGEITIKLEADRKRKITIISECEPAEKQQRAPSQSSTPRRRRTSDDLRRQTLVNNAIRSQSESQSRSRSRSKSRGRSLTRTRSRSGDKLIKKRQSRSRSRSRGRSASRGRSRSRAVAKPAPKEVQKQEEEHKPAFRLPTHLCPKEIIGSLAKKKAPEFLQLPAPLYILTEQQVVGASEKKTVQFVTKILLTSKKLTMDERKKLYAEMVEAEYVGTSRSTTDLIEDEPEEEFQCKIYYSDKGVYIHTVQNVKKLREGKCANVSEHKNYSKICKTRVVGNKGNIVEGTLNVSCQESFTVENQKYTRAENFKIGLKGTSVNGNVLISSFKSTFDPTKTTHFDEIIKFDKENIGIMVMHKASADMTEMWKHQMGSFGEEQCEYREIQFYFDEATPVTPPPKTRMIVPKLELKDVSLAVPQDAPKSAPSAPSTASNSSASVSTASSSNDSLGSQSSAPMGSLSSSSASSASSNLVSMNATNTECPSVNVTDGIRSDPPTSGSVTPKRTLTEAERSARSSRRMRSRAKRHKQRKRASSAASKSSDSTSAAVPKKQKSLDRCSSRKDRKDDAPLVFTKAPEMNSTLNNDTFIQSLPQATSTPKSPAKTNNSLLRSQAKSPRTPTIRDRSTTRLEEVDARGTDNEVDLDKSLSTKKPVAKNLSLVLEGEKQQQQKNTNPLTSTSLQSDRLSSHSGKSVASPKGTLRVKETKVTREVREEKGKPAEISEKKEETVKEEKVKLRGRSQSPSLGNKFVQLSAHEPTHQTVHITPIKVDVAPAASSNAAANSRHHQETVQIQMLIDKKHFNLNMNFDIIADKRPDVEVIGFSFAGKKLWEKSSDWPLSSANTTSQTKTIAVQASSILETDEKK